MEADLKKIKGWTAIEEEHLDKYLRKFRIEYGYRRPVDLFGKPGTRIYTYTKARKIMDFYSKIRSRVLAVLGRDIYEKVSMDVQQLIKRHIWRIGGAKRTIARLKDMLITIHNEFDEVIEYYEFILDNHKLPSSWSFGRQRRLAKYNYKMIIDPLENVKYGDLRLIGMYDRIIRTIKKERKKRLRKTA
jgi:hypothetical protein